MRWLETSGGPFLFLESKLLNCWNGHYETSSNHNMTDYERACEIENYTGIVSVNNGIGVVFGDEPDRMCLLPQADGSYLFIRWRWAPNEKAILDNLEKVNFSVTDERITFHIGSESISIFDAASRGNSIDEHFEFKVKVGDYTLETVMYEHEESRTCFLAHRLEWAK